MGVYLRQAVPTQHRHLLDDTELVNWHEMMSVLKDKFGTSKLVAGNVLTDLRGIRPITSDGGFVNFVEKVQRANRKERDGFIRKQIASYILHKLG